MKWEYKIYREAITEGNLKPIQNDLNTFGRAGWELVRIIEEQYGFCSYIFKRPK